MLKIGFHFLLIEHRCEIIVNFEIFSIFLQAVTVLKKNTDIWMVVRYFPYGRSILYIFFGLTGLGKQFCLQLSGRRNLTKDRLSVKEQIRPEFLSLGLWKNFENVPVGRGK